MATMTTVRKPPFQWIDDERTSLRAYVDDKTSRFLVDGCVISWSDGSNRRELIVTCTRPGHLDLSVVADLQGMSNPGGWRLRAIIPTRSGIQRAKDSSGSTSLAAATISRWINQWVAEAPQAKQAPSVDSLHAAASADLVGGTQALAARLRRLLTHKMGMKLQSLADLLLGLETLAAPHMDPGDVENLVLAVRRLFTHTTPLDGEDLEILSDICEVDLLWLTTGTGIDPLP